MKGHQWDLAHRELFRDRMRKYFNQHPEARLRCSLQNKAKPKSPEHRQKLREANLGKHPTEETRRKMSLAHKGQPHPWNKLRDYSGTNNPMYGRRGALNPFYGKQHKPETIAQLSEQNKRLSKEWWTNPEYREKVVKAVAEASHRRPNKPEQTLADLLEKIYPGEFEYNGDGKIIIFEMIPDFINVNGSKEVIELFGDYYHSPQVITSWRRSELGRLMAYNSVGYKCLVIWEYELYNKPQVELGSKIKQFRSKSRQCGRSSH